MHDDRFGQLLRRLRRAHDLTQEQLAELAGCAVDTLRAIESGRRRPSRELAAILAERLQVPPTERQAFLDRARAVSAEPASTPPQTASLTPAAPALPPLVALRAEAASLIGRASELELLTQRLTDPACRLLTLAGPGGIGKSSLASVLAARVAGGFPDGVLTLALAGAQHPPEAAGALAAALGLRPEHGQATTAQLVAALAPRRQLLVLDNLEQLLDGPELVELIAALLGEAPGVRLLVTSRERLRLQEEWVYELGGLALTADRAVSDAALLFVERARRLQADFALTTANAAAIDQICRLVGGTPLAIELAASWLPTLSPAEIAAELEHSLDLLDSDVRDLPARHRSVRAVFEGSWRLLTADEQQRLARLALFRGGFTREAAEFVAGTRLPQLAALRQQSLIRRQSERYMLHELIRQFCAEQLEHSGNSLASQQRFVDYYQAFAASVATSFSADGKREWVEHMAAEIDNLRAALRLALARRDATAGASLCMSVRFYWAMRGLLREGLQWVEQFLALPRLAERTRGLLLATSVPLYRQLGTWERALVHADAALGLLQAGEDDLARRAAYTGAGLAARDGGDFVRARSYLQACLTLDQALETRFYEAATLSNIAYTYLLEGQLDEAWHHFQVSVAVAQSAGAELVVAFGRYAISTITTLAGDRDGSGALRQALPILDAFGYQLGVIQCLEALAAQSGLRGEYQSGGRLHGAAAELRARSQLVVAPGFQAVYTRLAGLARGPLDDAEWEAALAAGRQLSQAEAVALALDEHQP